MTAATCSLASRVLGSVTGYAAAPSVNVWVFTGRGAPHLRDWGLPPSSAGARPRSGRCLVAACDDGLRHLVVRLAGVGRPSRQPVDVAVVHAEGRRDEDRVVDLEVGGACGAGCRDVAFGHGATAPLDRCRDLEQGTKAGAHGSLPRISLDALHDVVAAGDLTSREGGVREIAEPALVEAGHVR